MKTKYIYITSREYSSAVYQTQVIDWLNLYRTKGINFELWHVFHRTRHISKAIRQYRKTQLDQISKAYSGQTRVTFLMPEQMSFLNNIIFSKYISSRCKGYDRIVIFSRDKIGNEIKYLKNKLGNKILYYYDLRAATAEEKLLTLRSKRLFNKSEYEKVADYAYSEYLRQELADKIFVVSNALKSYFINNYYTIESKFVLYPCLSSSAKFYYDSNLRQKYRKLLNYTDEDNVYIYSGGVSGSWHIPDSFLRLFIEVVKKDSNARLLVMSPKLTDAIKKKVEDEDLLKSKVLLKEAIPNHEVVNYLNAADFGILLRENNPVNNVAFPSKYAEYILCGLPTIISEAVGDCADYCREYNSGYVLSNNMLNNLGQFEPLRKEKYDRTQIANKGKEALSKESALDRIVIEIEQ